MKKEVPLDKAYRLINQGSLVLVTSAHLDRINVMTLAWQTPVSVSPPQVGISVAAGHMTNELIRAGETFTINIPGPSLLPAVRLCGKYSGRQTDKFKEAGLTPVPGKKVRAPIIEECVGYLECGVTGRYTVGDHSFFIGEIVAAGVEESAFSDHWEDCPEGSTIHHLGGDWYYFSGPRES